MLYHITSFVSNVIGQKCGLYGTITHTFTTVSNMPVLCVGSGIKNNYMDYACGITHLCGYPSVLRQDYKLWVMNACKLDYLFAIVFVLIGYNFI